MNNPNDNPEKYKKPTKSTLFEKIANFVDKITGAKPEDRMTEEELEQFERDFDRLRFYTDKDGKRKWWLKR